MFLACRSWACQSSQITHALLTLRSFRYMSLGHQQEEPIRTDTRSGSRPAVPHIDSGYPGPQASWYCQRHYVLIGHLVHQFLQAVVLFLSPAPWAAYSPCAGLTHITGISAAPYNRQTPSSCTGGQWLPLKKMFICQLLYTVSCGFLWIFPPKI